MLLSPVLPPPVAANSRAHHRNIRPVTSAATLAQLEEAFSVEAVTKEFFNQYAALFGDIDAALQKLAAKDKTIGDEFKEKHVSTVDFAKKLMGQIVFLYFIQKKGWLGVAKGQDWGTGPRDFLRRLVSSSPLPSDNPSPVGRERVAEEIGRASCRERVLASV